MHYVGFEFLESLRIAPPLRDLSSIATPRDDVTFLCASRRLYRRSRGEPPEAVDLPADFAARFLVERPGDEILVVGDNGQGISLGFDGEALRRFFLGPDLADAATDDFGIFVLRQNGRLEKFTFDGRLIEDDRQVRSINVASHAKEGSILLVPYDGSVWVNLEEHFDESGEAMARVDAAALFGEGRVAGDLLGDDGLIVLGEDGRLTAVDERGRTREARLNREAVIRVLGRDLTARLDCLSTRDDLLTILSTDLCALTTFELYAE